MCVYDECECVSETIVHYPINKPAATHKVQWTILFDKCTDLFLTVEVGNWTMVKFRL